MNVARMWTLNEWRRRWIALGLLTLTFGAALAVVLAVGAGARRTSSAYDRLSDETLRYHASVEDQRGDDGVLDELAALPSVRASDRIALFFMTAPELDLQTLLVAPRDGVAFDQIDRPVLLEGRRPAEDAPGEVLANEAFVEATGVGPGGSFEVVGFTPDQLVNVLSTGDPGGPPAGPVIELEVVGVGRAPISVDRPDPQVLATPAFFAAFRGTAGNIDTIQRIALHRGDEGIDEFVAEVSALESFDPESVFLEFGSSDGARVIDGTRLQAVALVAFAAAAALATFVALAQAVSRHLESNRGDASTFAGLGLTTAGRGAVVAAPLAPVVAVGVIVAVAAAIAASSMFPTGLAARAEPDPGVAVDLAFLAPAALASVVVAAAIVLAAARRVVTPRADAPRPSFVAAALARSGIAPSALMGARMALEPGSGDRRLPVRATLLGTVLSIVVLAGAAAFSQSLDHMLETPRLYGWSWDATVTIGSDIEATREAADLMADSSDVRAVAIASDSELEINGSDVETHALTQVKGTIAPVLLEGSPPQGLDEIALGPAVLEEIDAGVGDRVTVEGLDGAEVRLLVSGSVLLPGGEDQQGLSAWVTPELLSDVGREGSGGYDLHIDVRDGTDVEELIDPIDGSGDVFLTEQPTTVKNIALTRSAPSQIAAFVSVLGLAAVAHALVTAARRRRHDIAVLRALGMLRRDSARIVGWHAGVLGLVATVIGVPIGFAAGRLVWTEFATGAHLVPEATFGVVWVAAVLAGPVLVTLLAAAIPAFGAARFPLAKALRTE